MPNTCGYIVDNWCKNLCKTRGWLSTHCYSSIYYSMRACRKVEVLHYFTHQLYAQFSTVIYTILPLIEHYFYPFSTRPTITTTN